MWRIIDVDLFKCVAMIDTDRYGSTGRKSDTPGRANDLVELLVKIRGITPGTASVDPRSKAEAHGDRILRLIGATLIGGEPVDAFDRPKQEVKEVERMACALEKKAAPGK